jgi:hypothetical protein
VDFIPDCADRFGDSTQSKIVGQASSDVSTHEVRCLPEHAQHNVITAEDCSHCAT